MTYFIIFGLFMLVVVGGLFVLALGIAVEQMGKRIYECGFNDGVLARDAQRPHYVYKGPSEHRRVN